MIRAQQGLRAREENKALPGLRARRVSRGQWVLRVCKACKVSGERKDIRAHKGREYQLLTPWSAPAPPLTFNPP